MYNNLKDLLLLEKAVKQVLKDKGVIKTDNYSLGDLSERLFAETFNLSLETKPNSGYDCISPKGDRYIVKGKIWPKDQDVIRFASSKDLQNGKFDYLGIVLFDENLEVIKAWNMTKDAAKKLFAPSGLRIGLGPEGFSHLPGVEDVTAQIAQTWAKLSKTRTLTNRTLTIEEKNHE